jgi:hypothetical protein
VGETEFGQYSVNKIGRRQKVDTSKQDKNTTIFQNKTPDALFSFFDDEGDEKKGTL